MDPGTATLIKEFSVAEFGGDRAELADIDGDGQLELLILQSPGQLKSRLHADRSDVDDADRSLHCLTAVSLEGEVLWQVGRPYRRDVPFTSHGPKSMLAEDIDGDGHCEVAMIRGSAVVILDGATGRQRSLVELPSDNFDLLHTAQFTRSAGQRHLICKVNDRAYPPWSYSNPTMVFRPDLRVWQEPFAVQGAGHSMVALDADGDGKDELLIGYSLLDDDLSEIWSLDLGYGFDYVSNHADSIAVSDLNLDGELEVRYSGSKDFLVTDLEGNILWRVRGKHSQRSAEGPWGPNAETRIIMCEKNEGLWGLDQNGEALWHRTDINGYAGAPVRWRRGIGRTEWALFEPQLRPITPAPYESDPAWSRDLWPSFIDGDGQLLDVFPWKDEYAQPRRRIRAERSYDCGVRYRTLAQDIDGDGLDEALIFDRDRVCIFKSPEAGNA
jgi:hypothetical protein